ncbi:MAG TPA: hypothetical protein PK771_10310, partial [Spirochaetota bacterium]|nr:hypothetical protein [Spirochaetota bacterium]
MFSRDKIVYSSLFLFSITLIAFELAVIRTFAVGNWSNFGTFVISTALLGFGFAGTLLTFIQPVIKKKPERWLLWITIFLAPVMVISHILAQQVPFNPILIASDPRQLIWIGVFYLIYAVP